MRRLIIAVTALTLAAPVSAAGGGDPLSFLSIDGNARPAGMGGAYTAVAADASAFLYNPAGLGLIKRHEATFMHNAYFEGMSQEYAAYASPWGWGGHLNIFDFGRVPETTISNPGGTGRTNSLRDLSLGAGYGRIVAERLSVGGQVKFIQETIAGVTARAYAFDVGVLYSPPRIGELTLGAALQNAGPSLRFVREKENLPLTGRVGAAYSFTLIGPKITLACDVFRERSDKTQFAAGGEIVIAHVMPVRMGFTTLNQAGIGIAVGVGWFLKDFSLDYAFAPYGELGLTNRVSLTYRWGDARRGAEPVAPKQEREPRLSGGWRLTPEQRFSRAGQFMEVRRFDEAKAELEEASELLDQEDRRRVAYFERLGHLYYLQSNLTMAKSSFEEAIRLASGIGLKDPSVAEAYAGMGLCLLQEKNQPYAAKFFRKALEVGPSERTRVLMEDMLRGMPEP